MKRIALILVGSLLCVASAFAQKELTISGGNCVSAMVCQNSVVYTWGKNSTNTGSGLLGTGSSNPYESTPQEVKYFTEKNIDIQQVNCGSGSHFIALDCQGQVWCWGNNSLGQCGTGGSVVKSEGKIQATPVQVSTAGGDLKGTVYSKDNHLTKVDVVYAGNNNSFAILGDGPYKGCLVGWGGNSTGFDGQGYDNAFGQLGCGNTDNQAYPMFVLDGSTKKPLQGVVQVYAGDNAAYALVDPDGDGIGTIYSWGYQKGNGALGRSATGGVGNTNDFNDPYARPVIKGDGTPLTNIKMLGCGDGVGYGLDVDGYIWAWGNGAWNNSAGVLDANYSWYSGSDTYATPLRVRAGLTTGASNDGEFLLAKWVSGGQGFGMAITGDNKPVAWGGGGCGDGGGGATGSKIGQSKEKAGAEYIVGPGGKIANNVVLINRADLWGFYGTSNGDLFAWGCNSNGELGIGSTLSQNAAVKINPPSNCKPRHPDPVVDLTPGDMTVCASAFKGQTLDAGFVIDLTLADFYKITWYKDGTEILSGSVKEQGVTYKATEPGTYKVVIEHETNGTGGGCIKYDPAVGEVTISAFEQTFTTPDLEYCGDSATVYVNAATGSKATYSWYASKGSTAKAIATTTGSEKVKIDVSDIAANNGKKVIYVEETAAGGGSFLPSSFAPHNSSQSIGQPNNISNPGFTVSTPINLTDFKLKAQGTMQSYYVNGTATLSGSLVFTVNLCKSKTDNGKLVADKTAIVKSFTGTMKMEKEITATGKYTFTDEVVFDADNYQLQPGTYFLVFSKADKTGDADANSSYVYGAAKGIVDVKDTYSGDYIVGIGAAQDNNFKTDQAGVFYDINFSTPQGFCDRLAVDVIENCPCVAPEEFTIECDDAYFSETKDSVVVCANNAVATLTTTPWAASTSKAFEYIWYKDGSISKAATVGASSANFSVTSTGEYKILVRDKAVPEAVACQKTATVTVYENALPTVTISGGGEICYGETLSTPVKMTMTGTPGFTVKYKTNGKSGQKKTRGKVSTVELDVPTAVGTYEYVLTSVNDDNNCLNEDVKGTATIVIKPIPTATIKADKDEVCEGESIKLEASSDQAD
ncbi:MAG: hypothetical protein MJ204_10695, partial [Bacteroidales bacterium]|nr:hypothetical protein [Bacteroidales bacterium]